MFACLFSSEGIGHLSAQDYIDADDCTRKNMDLLEHIWRNATKIIRKAQRIEMGTPYWGPSIYKGPQKEVCSGSTRGTVLN